MLAQRPAEGAGIWAWPPTLCGARTATGRSFEISWAVPVIVSSLGDAVRMAKKYDNAFKIVSLDGQVINAGGSMTGGSASGHSGILSRANELKRLEAERTSLAAACERAAAGLQAASRELEATRYELQVAQGELDEAREEQHRRQSLAAQARQLAESIDAELSGLESERAAIAVRLQESEERVERTRADNARLEAELEALKTERASLSQGREDIEAESARLAEERSSLRASAASLEAERAAACRTIEQLFLLRRELSGDSGQRHGAMAELENRCAATEEELRAREQRLAEYRNRIGRLKEELQEAVGRRLALEGKRTAVDKEAQEKNRELLELERRSAQLEQKILAADLEEKQIIDKLWDTYELSRSAAQAARQPLESVSQANRRASELRRAIAALGNPNLGAIEEYQRVSARYDFLTEQRDDVEKAKRELQKIIADLTKEMQEIFLREFRAIDLHFGRPFWSCSEEAARRCCWRTRTMYSTAASRSRFSRRASPCPR